MLKQIGKQPQLKLKSENFTHLEMPRCNLRPRVLVPWPNARVPVPGGPKKPRIGNYIHGISYSTIFQYCQMKCHSVSIMFHLNRIEFEYSIMFSLGEIESN